jgi:hypothetical protein
MDVSVEDDALRFHCCLLWDGDESVRLDARELADTVQTVLVDQLEYWMTGVFRYCADVADSYVPLVPDWAGLAAALLSEVPYDVEAALAPARFAPNQAAALLAEATAAAAGDLSRIRSAPPRRLDRHLGCLAAHLELLARLAVVVRPLMPGWSTFVTRHLGLTGDPALRNRLARPLSRTPVLSPGLRISPALPIYFRTLGHSFEQT